MRRITHVLVATVAASAMAASTAAAKSVDRVDRFDSPTSSLAGTAEKQDLRGEHARDAARFNGQTPSRGTPQVYWSYDYEAPKPSAHPNAAPASKPTDDTDVWVILAIALAATGIVAGSTFVVSRRSRVRVPA